MQFLNRKMAGKQLGEEIKKTPNLKDAVVIALPRGGVIIGHEVAKILHCPLDIVVPRKIGAPGNPEFAIGVVTEDGQAILNSEIIRDYDIEEKYLKETIQKNKQEAERRLALYRGGRPAVDIRDKTVIVVDDGIATGFTMKAALKSIFSKHPKRVILAVPVSPLGSSNTLGFMVDEFIVLHTPEYFAAVGQFYQQFEQTSDEEVIEIMKQYQ